MVSPPSVVSNASVERSAMASSRRRLPSCQAALFVSRSDTEPPIHRWRVDRLFEDVEVVEGEVLDGRVRIDAVCGAP